MKTLLLTTALLFSQISWASGTAGFCVASGEEAKIENALVEIENGNLKGHAIPALAVSDQFFDLKTFNEEEIYTFDWGGAFYLKKVVFETPHAQGFEDVFFVLSSELHGLKIERQLVDCFSQPDKEIE